MKLLLLFLSSLAMAQTPIAEMPNAMSVCSENQACVITAVSDPTAVLQFGSGAKWCQTVTASTLKLPATVSYTTSAICSYDPIPFTSKTLAAVQKSTAFTITYTLAGVKQPAMTIPALVAVKPLPLPLPLPTIVATYNCTINVYSDGTYQSSNCSAVTQ